MNTETTQCRDDGRCQYAIDHGAEGIGACPVGQCCQSYVATLRDSVELVCFDVMTGLIVSDAELYVALSKFTPMTENMIQYKMRYGYLEPLLRNQAGEYATASTEGVAVVLRRLRADQRIVEAAINGRPQP